MVLKYGNFKYYHFSIGKTYLVLKLHTSIFFLIVTNECLFSLD